MKISKSLFIFHYMLAVLVLPVKSTTRTSGIIPAFLQFSDYNISALPYLTAENSNFNSHIEGLNVAPSGRVYAVQYEFGSKSNVVGQIYPQQNIMFVDKNQNSYFNGMHFLSQSVAYVVDSSDNKRLLQLQLDQNGHVLWSKTHCHDDAMLPLNDLAISFTTGAIYLSAMNWTNTSTNRDGQIWVCSAEGHSKLLHVMGGVNGIELSLDEKTLYATESFTRNWTHISSKIWKFKVDPGRRRISDKKLFVDMGTVPGDSAGFAMDGIKTDVNGNLLAVRYGGSSVAVFSSKRQLLGRIHLNFKNPANLELVTIGQSNYLFICGSCDADPDGVRGCVDIVEWPLIGRSSHNFLHQKLKIKTKM